MELLCAASMATLRAEASRSSPKAEGGIEAEADLPVRPTSETTPKPQPGQRADASEQRSLSRALSAPSAACLPCLASPFCARTQRLRNLQTLTNGARALRRRCCSTGCHQQCPSVACAICKTKTRPAQAAGALDLSDTMLPRGKRGPHIRLLTKRPCCTESWALLH